jgi:hypothetical protein
MLTRPRLNPPSEDDVAERLREIDLRATVDSREDLEVFYHPQTLQEICALRHYLLQREAAGAIDDLDDWIRMVACSRLTGHSPGFFSVYSLPPNQAASVVAQDRINAARGQAPPRRDVAERILKKTQSLLRHYDPETGLGAAARGAMLLTADAEDTPAIASGSVDLVVTSPPFLDVVDYAETNWLRLWFCGIDADEMRLTMCRTVEDWQESMTSVFHELARVLRPGGRIAFEVGEVKGGKVFLDEAAIPCGITAGLEPEVVMINDQEFTKTAHCWGVSNRKKGTNTNRIVVFCK